MFLSGKMVFMMDELENPPQDLPNRQEPSNDPAETNESTQPILTNGAAGQPTSAPLAPEENPAPADPGDTQPTAPGAVEHHPTGDPNATGGWYAEMEMPSPYAAQTQAILPPDQQPTQAFVPPDQQVTQASLPASQQPTQAVVPPSQ